MKKEIDCDHIPECEIGDNGCDEQLWTWKQYCSNRETGPVLPDDTPLPEDAPLPEATIHVPVDTSGNVGDAFICTGCLLAIFGISFLVVAALTFVRGRKDNL